MGFVNATSTLTYVSANLNVSTTGSGAGGVIGFASAPTTASYSAFVGTSVSGGNYVGGFVGAGNSLTATYSYVRAGSPITLTSSGANVGGFTGQSGTYTDCYSRVETIVMSTNGSGVGGFSGNGGTLTRVYSTVAYLDTTSTSIAAGGYGASAADTIARSDVQVDANDNGSADGVDVSSTYPGGAVIATSAEMIVRSLYAGRGFNFASVWRMPAGGVNDDYPILQWETPGYTAPTVSSLFAGGSGTVGDPWQIGTAAQLGDFPVAIQIDSNTADDYYLLTADIDMSGVGAPMVGTSTVPFRGAFDGGSHTISNLTATWRNGTNRGALFGYLGAGAYLHDFTISGLTVTHAAAGTCSGGLVGNSVGSAMTNETTKVRMHDVTLSGAVSLTFSGGTSGLGALFGCTSYTEIGADGSTPVTINAASGGLTASSGSDVGGAVGSIVATTNLRYVTSNLNVSAGGQVVGGLIGRSNPSSTASYCGFSGTNVTGAAYTGGFVGYGYGLTATYSYVRSPTTTTVVGTDLVGGFVGNAGTFTDCYSRTDTVQSSSNGGNVGGFCGTGCTLTRTYSTASFLDTTSTSIGALCYNCTGPSPSNCFAVEGVYRDTDSDGLPDVADASGTYPGGATIKTEAQMMDSTTFTGAAWDNTGTYWEYPGVDFPVLTFEP